MCKGTSRSVQNSSLQYNRPQGNGALGTKNELILHDVRIHVNVRYDNRVLFVPVPDAEKDDQVVLACRFINCPRQRERLMLERCSNFVRRRRRWQVKSIWGFYTTT